MSQLGDGSTTQRYTPVGVIGLSGDVSSISLGGVRPIDLICLISRRCAIDVCVDDVRLCFFRACARRLIFVYRSASPHVA